MDTGNITDPVITKTERRGLPESETEKFVCLNCSKKVPNDCLVICTNENCLKSGCKSEDCFVYDEELGCYYCCTECQIRSLEQARQKLERQLAEAESAFYKKMGDIGRGIDELNGKIKSLETD